MNFWIRVGIAVVALFATALYWSAAEEIATKFARGYYSADIAPTVPVFRLRLVAATLVCMALYGGGAHLWRRLDDWLRRKNSK